MVEELQWMGRCWLGNKKTWVPVMPLQTHLLCNPEQATSEFLFPKLWNRDNNFYEPCKILKCWYKWVANKRKAPLDEVLSSSQVAACPCGWFMLFESSEELE
jgi:hypothetical protein